MLQKGEHPLEGEILHRQLRDRPARVRRHEREEQPQRVAIAANRGRPQALLCGQVIEEEAVDQRAKGDGRHDRPSMMDGTASASKRRLAAAYRSLVIVKYTAVVSGRTWPRKVER